jgi:thioester reductase-like protein
MNDWDKIQIEALKKAAAKINTLKDEVTKLKSTQSHESLAIIGMNCVLPGGANSTKLFWEKLLDGYDGVSQVPSDRWDSEAYYDEDPSTPGKINTKYGGFIDRDVFQFDAAFFGISPKEAKTMDPQQRLLLETTWKALENAAINPDTLKETNTGVFIGSCLNDYQLILNKKPEKDINAYIATGNSASVMAGRIAYYLGTHGPAVACDTACSSSLVAVHLASNALRNNETNIAIVGGVNLLLSPQNFIVFTKAHMLSNDGHCKTFDENADGYVRGEGCGVIVLKRLSDAEKNNDNILAIIKGSAINQDGSSSGLTVPNMTAQEQVISAALRDANLEPEDIDLIETHGTGTKIGDPIETQAINKVFSGRQSPLMLSSVKTNIGHLEGAAGIAGLIKVVLSLQNKIIPKHNHFKKLNPLINIDAIKGVIPLSTQKWPSTKNRVRRASVSSFGFSGTNAHVVIEESNSENNTANNLINEHLFCFSAKSLESLEAYLQSFSSFLSEKQSEKLSPYDISYTLNVGRAQLKHRAIFYADTKEDLKQKLDNNSFLLPDQINKIDVKFQEKAALFLKGGKVDLSSLYQNNANKLALPSYVFDKTRYSENISDINNQSNNIDDIGIYDTTWQIIPPGKINTYKNNNVFICQNNILSLQEINEDELDNIEGYRIVLTHKKQDFKALITFTQRLLKNNISLPAGFFIITTEALILPNDNKSIKSEYIKAHLVGLIKTLIWEAPKLNPVLLDIDSHHNIDDVYQLIPSDTGPFIALREGKFFQPTIKVKSSKKISPIKPFDMSGTHWITGGTGTLGLALASKLIEEGVTSLILTSRSGETPAFNNWLKSIHTNKINIIVVSLDITKKKDVVSFLDKYNSNENPIKGIYHLAGINLQKNLKELSIKEINNTTAAKMKGAKYLNALTTKLKLNYFVLFSSIASFAGSNRQLPYVISNYFLDMISAERSNLKQPSLVINWGPFANSNMVGSKIETSMLLSIESSMSFLMKLLKSNETNVAALKNSYIPFMFSFFTSEKTKWLGDLLPFIKNEDTQSAHTSAFLKELKQLTSSDRKLKIRKLISETIQHSLDLPNLPSIHEGFFELGMDSLMSVEIGKKIQDSIGIKIKPTAIFDYPNINAISNHIDSKIENQPLPTVLTESKKSNDTIGIMGMSCHFPGEADSLDAFWDCLKNGKDCISNLPPGRFDTCYFDNDPRFQNLKGGFIKNIEMFDADFFGISPREARYLDPQQRLILINTWFALEHAGINPHSLKGKNVGIFVGISQSEYATSRVEDEDSANIYKLTGNALNVSAGRLAYTLGTKGPAMAIDTACSSSLVALHEACNSLKSNDCELAIVCGVNAILDPRILMNLSSAEMLSPDGACKTFDDAANGYVRSEGCGVVILKSTQALKKSERLLAVIRATNVNQDGSSSGLTVPNGVAQAKLISRTLQKAGLEPNEIAYLEAHGSGTNLGDPIEVGAISDVFSGRKSPLILGAVKTNIGHLESASGIAGVIKTVLCLKNNWIPKHLHFKKLNRRIDLRSIPAILPEDGCSLNSNKNKRLLAGISSFGFSGTNAHVILEEAREKPEKAALSNNDCLQLFVLSSKTEAGLHKQIIQYTAFLKTTSHSLANICYSAAAGRAHFKYRIAISTNTISDLLLKLNQIKIVSIKPHDSFETLLSRDITEIIESYNKGIEIDWEHFFQADIKNLKTIDLPKYCFDLKSYWINASTNSFKKSENNPLLENHTFSPKNKEHIFTTQLRNSRYSFIKDHTIYDLPVIAGATYVSMLISFLTDILKKDTGVLSKFTFIQPLIVDSRNARNLQLIVKELENESEFELLSYLDNNPDSYITHAQGSIQLESISSNKQFNMQEINQSLTQLYGGKTHQKNVEKVKLKLGPHFHWIEHVKFSDIELISTLRRPTSSESKGYLLFPGLIDSSFQSMLAWVDFDLENATLHIPVSIDRISFSNIKESPHYIYICKRPKDKKVDISYLDSNGKEFVSIKGFSIREVTEETLKKIMDFQYQSLTPTYFLDWHKASKDLLKAHDIPRPDIDLLVIDPTNNTHTYLKKALSSINVNFNRTMPRKASTHVLFIASSEFNSDNTKYISLLNQEIKQIINNEQVESIGILVHNSLKQSVIHGYWKSLSLEAIEKNIYLIESNPNENTDLISNIIYAQLNKKIDEEIISIQHNSIYVPRLLNKEAYDSRAMLLPYSKEPATFHATQGLINNLQWKNIKLPTLKCDQVRIQVKITSLNFRDVLKFMGTYPGKPEWHLFEHVGVVTNVGKKVKAVKPGDKVLTLSENTFCTVSYQTESAAIKIPPHLSMKEACSIPGVFLTAYSTIYELANIKEGQNILIHAATGGVGLAAIQLARLKKANIFVTSSAPKQNYLHSIGIKHTYNSRELGFAKQILKDTKNKGVDVVLNSLTGDGFIEESLQTLKKGGVFIELGKINIFSKEKISAIRSDIQYHIFALDKRMALEQNKIKSQLEAIFKLFQQGKCHPLPYTVFDVRESIQAFRYLQRAQHIGKVLIEHTPPFKYSKAKTYLITGGLGALSKMLVPHLLSQGVQNILLIGRKNITSDPAWISKHQKNGVSISYIAIDITQQSQINKLLINLNQTSFPLGGIFHLAGSLSDKTIPNLTDDDFRQSFEAKVFGTLSLHEVTKSLEIDCFVMFSSITSSFGAPGQANYAAANAFMDSLAKYRHKEGLPALAINWGPFADNGMAKDYIKKYTQNGLLPLDPNTAFNTMDELLKQPYSEVIIGDFDWNKFSKLIHNKKLLSLSHQANKKKEIDLFLLLKNSKLSEREIILENELKKIVASVLYIEETDEINVETGFFELGFDSLMSVEMWNRLQSIVGTNQKLSKTLLFECSNISKLQDHLQTTIFSDIFPQSSKEETLQELEKILADTNDDKIALPNLANQEQERNANLTKESSKSRDKINILLTGSTGILGGYIAKLILANPNIKLHCIVRANDSLHAYYKLRLMLKTYKIDNDMIPMIEKRISIYLGDIELDKLGLNDADYNYLSSCINSTIHSAANLSLKDNYETLYDTNVVGTKNVIKFALTTSQKNFLYVSTYAVMGDIQISPNKPFKETDFDLSQGFDQMGYQKTKFESEKLIRQAQIEGLNWKIVRPGNIFGDSIGGSYPLNLNGRSSIFYDLFKTIIETNVAVESLCYFDITPVDYVAKAIMHIALNSPKNTTYHLTNPDLKTFSYIMKTLNQIGYNLEFVSVDQYKHRLYTKQLTYQGEPYESLTTALLQYNFDLAIPDSSTPPDATFTSKLLAEAGIDCPKIDKAFVLRLLKYCITEGYLPKPLIRKDRLEELA